MIGLFQSLQTPLQALAVSDFQYSKQASQIYERPNSSKVNKEWSVPNFGSLPILGGTAFVEGTASSREASSNGGISLLHSASNSGIALLHSASNRGIALLHSASNHI